MSRLHEAQSLFEETTYDRLPLLCLAMSLLHEAQSLFEETTYDRLPLLCWAMSLLHEAQSLFEETTYDRNAHRIPREKIPQFMGPVSALSALFSACSGLFAPFRAFPALFRPVFVCFRPFRGLPRIRETPTTGQIFRALFWSDFWTFFGGPFRRLC
jgi:hypothetical protein